MPEKKRSRHGLHRLKVAVRLEGLGALDERTAAARWAIDYRAKLIDDLGGEEFLSAMKATVVEVVWRTRALLDHVDHHLLSSGAIVNKRSRTLHRLVVERQALADQLARQLSLLGLNRVEPPAPSLADYIREQDERAKSDADKQASDAPDDSIEADADTHSIAAPDESEFPSMDEEPKR